MLPTTLSKETEALTLSSDRGLPMKMTMRCL